MSSQQIELLRQMKARRPFVPFRIVTSDGKTHLMSDRFQFAVGQGGAMFYPTSDAALWVALRADQIVAVQQVDEASAA